MHRRLLGLGSPNSQNLPRENLSRVQLKMKSFPRSNLPRKSSTRARLRRGSLLRSNSRRGDLPRANPLEKNHLRLLLKTSINTLMLLWRDSSILMLREPRLLILQRPINFLTVFLETLLLVDPKHGLVARNYSSLSHLRMRLVTR